MNGGYFIVLFLLLCIWVHPKPTIEQNQRAVAREFEKMQETIEWLKSIRSKDNENR